MLSLCVDVLSVICTKLSRADVVNLLFRTCQPLRERDWGVLLSRLPDFQHLMVLRDASCSTTAFLASVMSLDFFAGFVFLDNEKLRDSEADKHGEEGLKVMFPPTHRSFLRFGLLTHRCTACWAQTGASSSPLAQIEVVVQQTRDCFK